MHNPIMYTDPTGYLVWKLPPLYKIVQGLLYGAAAVTAATVAAHFAANFVSATVELIDTFTSTNSDAINMQNIILAQINAMYWETTGARDWAVERFDAKLDHRTMGGHIVYVIWDDNKQEFYYVGRTTNFVQRRYKHSKDERFIGRTINMRPVMGDLTEPQARALEQLLITGFTIEALQNKINSIAEGNWYKFQSETERLRLLLKI